MGLWVVWIIAAAVLGVAELLTTTLALGLASRHDAAQRDRQHGPRADADFARQDQFKAEREKRAAILHAEGLGQAQAISTVFRSIHDGDPDPKLLAYQYLQTFPQLAQDNGNTVWMIPSELTGALRMQPTRSQADGQAGG